MPLHRFFRCPFCPTGRGDLNIDTTAVVAAAPAPLEGAVHIDASDARQRILVFNPDGAEQKPCPHLISLCFEGTLKERDDPHMSGSGTFSPNVDWDHAWLKTPKGDACKEFLWLTLTEPPPRGVRPSTPYRIRRNCRLFDIRGTSLCIHYVSNVIIAIDRRGFFRELPVCQRRWEDLVDAGSDR